MSYALEIQKLEKIYQDNLRALNGINLNVSSGDFYALLGHNGAGKTTLLGIISSLINKTAGKIKIFDYDLQDNMVNAKRLLGLVPQEFNFNPFESVLQIIVNQAGYYGIEKREALIKAKTYLTELGLWEKRYQRARLLSGGMKRRLMIARALIHNPKLLILDEPTAGVDMEIRHLIWKFLDKMNKCGTTIILTTHYLEEAEILCRNIGILQQGLLVINTSIKKLISKLKTEYFILDLDKQYQIPKLNGYQCKVIDNYTLEVQVQREQGLNSIFNQLSTQGIQVLSMRNQANRLEALLLEFMQYPKKMYNSNE
ncbi:MAG: ABC transporter ATP-binding protein [Candidatus Dasytiphilus stammeri]